VEKYMQHQKIKTESSTEANWLECVILSDKYYWPRFSLLVTRLEIILSFKIARVLFCWAKLEGFIIQVYLTNWFFI